ncbi:NlpC/P60 family protein [Nocardia takedensis]|uniref:NlpC/P60 family protein n=1 Tax=Nocardia takedensis TaxID=259390 RepID=UPI0002D762FF|nr:NlpC/P60 family protein [Nocardia takedensis]
MRTFADGFRRRLPIAMGLLTVVTVVLSAGQVGGVPPAPPNPSDGQIAQAGDRVQAQVGAVGALINQVASVDQQVRELDDAAALRREEVNKALVDLQNARDAADAAAAAVERSARELDEAGAQLTRARQEFDEFATGAYTRPTSGSMVTYLTATGPGGAIDRSQILGLVSRNQQQAMDGLRRAQIEQGNKNSGARQAKAAADAATARAEDAKSGAEAAVAAVQAELAAQNARRAGLLEERAAAQGRLDAARSDVAGLQSQREAYLSWDQQRRAEEAALQAAARAAAARAAADAAAAARAAELGAEKRPHADLENAAPPRRGTVPRPSPTLPSPTGSTAVETVVDRAMSQLGVVYAWGGGDENGPTLGIRDGGVADSHGDFNKTGFDCSGLMVYAFAGIGVSLPHYSGYQYNAGTRVPVDEKERGDMLFWGPNGSQHVALYLGDGTMVEAPQSGDVVKVSPVREAGIMPFAVRVVD